MEISFNKTNMVYIADPITGDIKPYVLVKSIKDYVLVTDFHTAFIVYAHDCFKLSEMANA